MKLEYTACSDFELLGAGTLTFYNGNPTDIPVDGEPMVVELWASWYAMCTQKSACFSRKTLRLRAHVLSCVVVFPKNSGGWGFSMLDLRCGPCRMAFPHLTQLAQKYCNSGLRIVGISSEPASDALRAFVKSQGNRMDYTVRHSLLQ